MVATKKRTSGLTDVFGECFDVTRPAVLSHFQSKDCVDRVDVWFPIVHRGQDQFFGEYPLEAIFQKALTKLGRQAVSEGEWRVQVSDMVTRGPISPQFRNADAQSPVPITNFKCNAEIVDGSMQIQVDDLNQVPSVLRPSGVSVWLERL
jgi:hypothetical protein